MFLFFFFFIFLSNGDNLSDFLFAFLGGEALPKKMGRTLEGKNLLPQGSKFFPLRADSH